MMSSPDQPLLNDVTIEITNQCQLRCQHCGIWAEHDRHELPASLVIRLIRDILSKYRVYFFSITGGEPFLHKDCASILRSLAFFRQQGHIRGFGIYCNAAYFQGVYRALSDDSQDFHGMEMGVSIDGGERTHDQLRGPGAYQKTLKTLSWIIGHFRHNINLELKFTINHLNYMELKDVYELARRFHARFSPKIMEDGVTSYYHRHVMPDTQDLASLTPRMKAVVLDQIEQILGDGYKGVNQELMKALITLLKGGKRCIRACETPARSLFVTSRRHVYPCLYLTPVGKIDDLGRLPNALEGTKKKHADQALRGECPRCFAYHGFLQAFNLPYLAE